MHISIVAKSSMLFLLLHYIFIHATLMRVHKNEISYKQFLSESRAAINTHMRRLQKKEEEQKVAHTSTHTHTSMPQAISPLRMLHNQCGSTIQILNCDELKAQSGDRLRQRCVATCHAALEVQLILICFLLFIYFFFHL